MTTPEPTVSHVDLYHKLGKLEGLMETMMTSVSAFSGAIKDVHSRIDALETRQSALETKQSASQSSMSTVNSIAKDFAIPLLAVAVTWLVATSQQPDKQKGAASAFSLPPANQYRSEYKSSH